MTKSSNKIRLIAVTLTGILAFTAPSLVSAAGPNVRTNPAVDIDSARAMVSGAVTPAGSPTTCFFEYGTNQSFGSRTLISSSVGSGGSNIPLEDFLSGLSANTTYYFRATCQDSSGISFGDTLSFTTTSGVSVGGWGGSGGGGGGGNSANFPIVYTNSAGGIGSNAAILNGTVNTNGYNTNYWFEYGTGYYPGQTTGSQYLAYSSGQQSVSFPLFGLAAGTVYSFRMVAQNSYGTVYGSIVTLVTTGGGGYSGGSYYGNCNYVSNYNNYNYGYIYSATPPCAQTNSPVNLTQTSADFSAQIGPNGSDTTAWFEYGLNSSPLTNQTASTQVQNFNNNYNLLTSVIGLTPATTYYVRVVARNTAGSTNGQTFQFQTAGTKVVPPPVAYVPPSQPLPVKSSGLVLGTQTRRVTVAAPKPAASVTEPQVTAQVSSSATGSASLLSIFGGWGWLWLLLLLLVALAVYWIFFREDNKQTAKQKIEASIS